MDYNVRELNAKYDFVVHSASYIGCPENYTVMYVTKKVEQLIHNLEQAHSCLVFAENTIQIPAELEKKHCFVLCDNPQLAYAEFIGALAQEMETRNRSRRYTLTDGGYYIGENVVIGEDAVIEPTCVISHDVVIGSHARIRAGAKIRNAVIGDYFLAGENCVIGGNGFTMAVDKNGNKVRIPTIGRVIIGNYVEVGALANISMGSTGDTHIMDYAKIDALVHIGHDASLGDNVELPAGAVVGGFTKLGSKAYVGINASLKNRLVIGENALVGMGTVVTKNVEPNKVVVGVPARVIRDNN